MWRGNLKTVLLVQDVKYLQEHDERARLHFEEWKQRTEVRLRAKRAEERERVAARTQEFERMRAEYAARNEHEVRITSHAG